MANQEIIITQPYILSETDENGLITFVSETFCEVAGYSKEELLGQPHNIVRHPDMPRVAFQGLWNDLRTKGFWKGIVKNKTKHDDYYWVEAMALRKIDRQGKITYSSVRTAASRAQIEWAEELYKTLH